MRRAVLLPAAGRGGRAGGGVPPTTRNLRTATARPGSPGRRARAEHDLVDRPSGLRAGGAPGVSAEPSDGDAPATARRRALSSGPPLPAAGRRAADGPAGRRATGRRRRRRGADPIASACASGSAACRGRGAGVVGRGQPVLFLHGFSGAASHGAGDRGSAAGSARSCRTCPGTRRRAGRRRRCRRPRMRGVGRRDSVRCAGGRRRSAPRVGGAHRGGPRHAVPGALGAERVDVVGYSRAPASRCASPWTVRRSFDDWSWRRRPCGDRRSRRRAARTGGRRGLGAGCRGRGDRRVRRPLGVGAGAGRGGRVRPGRAPPPAGGCAPTSRWASRRRSCTPARAPWSHSPAPRRGVGADARRHRRHLLIPPGRAPRRSRRASPGRAWPSRAPATLRTSNVPTASTPSSWTSSRSNCRTTTPDPAPSPSPGAPS